MINVLDIKDGQVYRNQAGTQFIYVGITSNTCFSYTVFDSLEDLFCWRLIAGKRSSYHDYTYKVRFNLLFPNAVLVDHAT